MKLRLKTKPWRKPRSETYGLFPTVEAALARILPGGIDDRRALRTAWVLVTWLLRKHTGPLVIGRSFPLDRRALAQIEDLGLTEHRIRIAVAHLERLGLLTRERAKGTGYQHRPDGGARRRAVIYRLAPFLLRLIRAVQAANPFKKPISTSPAKQGALMGRTGPAWVPPRAATAPGAPDPRLEGSLHRIAEALAARRQARAGHAAGDHA